MTDSYSEHWWSLGNASGTKPLHIFGTALVLYILYYLISAIYLTYFHSLSSFPGPKLWAISRLPLAWHSMRGESWQVFEKLHAKYGHTIRIAPDEITTTSASAWKNVYASKPLLLKDPFSQTPPLNGADSLFTAVGDTHRRMRGALASAFSDKALRDQSPIIESYANDLIARLRRDIAKTGNTAVNIQKFYGYTALDIISDLTFGESFHGLQGDAEHNRIGLYYMHAQFSTVRSILSRFYPLDVLFGGIVLRLTSKQRAKNWVVLVDKIDRRLAMTDAGATRSDFLTPLEGKVNEGKVRSLTKSELTTNSVGITIAGCQLPTVALSTATYLLLRNGNTLQTLIEEIQGASFREERDITVKSTEGLPYLDAVINEALRMHHPTPIQLPRVVAKGGWEFDGKFISENSVIGVNLQNIQNSPENWIEPLTFHPERFLPATDPRYDTKFDADNKAAFMPFSTGPRNCIGGKVFLAEARLILTKMLWSFDMRLADVDDVNWLKQKAYLVFEPKPLHVKLVERHIDVAEI